MDEPTCAKELAETLFGSACLQSGPAGCYSDSELALAWAEMARCIRQNDEHGLRAALALWNDIPPPPGPPFYLRSPEAVRHIGFLDREPHLFLLAARSAGYPACKALADFWSAKHAGEISIARLLPALGCKVPQDRSALYASAVDYAKEKGDPAACAIACDSPALLCAWLDTPLGAGAFAPGGAPLAFENTFFAAALAAGAPKCARLLSEFAPALRETLEAGGLPEAFWGAFCKGAESREPLAESLWLACCCALCKGCASLHPTAAGPFSPDACRGACERLRRLQSCRETRKAEACAKALGSAMALLPATEESFANAMLVVSMAFPCLGERAAPLIEAGKLLAFSEPARLNKIQARL